LVCDLGLPRVIIKTHQDKSGRGHKLGELPKILKFPFNIFATAEASDFKFGMQFGFSKAHHKITPRGKRERVPGLGELPKILGFPFNIYAMAVQMDSPACLLSCTENPCVCADHRTAIVIYYQSIIRQVSDVLALHSVKRRFNNRSVPGWSDYVADKHDVTKKAFK